jgi:hypothetical protein
VTTSPQFLKNASHKDWHELIYEAPPSHQEFTEEELVELLKSTVKRKTWVIIKGRVQSLRLGKTPRFDPLWSESSLLSATAIYQTTLDLD